MPSRRDRERRRPVNLAEPCHPLPVTVHRRRTDPGRGSSLCQGHAASDEALEVEQAPGTSGRALLQEAVARVEAHLTEHPDLVAKIGVSGIVASIWMLLVTYAAAVDNFADRFEQARKDGWEVDRLAAMVTEPFRKVALDFGAFA
jgi:hypothetical protein